MSKSADRLASDGPKKRSLSQSQDGFQKSKPKILVSVHKNSKLVDLDQKSMAKRNFVIKGENMFDIGPTTFASFQKAADRRYFIKSSLSRIKENKSTAVHKSVDGPPANIPTKKGDYSTEIAAVSNTKMKSRVTLRENLMGVASKYQVMIAENITIKKQFNRNRFNGERRLSVPKPANEGLNGTLLSTNLDGDRQIDTQITPFELKKSPLLKKLSLDAGNLDHAPHENHLSKPQTDHRRSSHPLMVKIDIKGFSIGNAPKSYESIRRLVIKASLKISALLMGGFKKRDVSCANLVLPIRHSADAVVLSSASSCVSRRL